jgi:hypothetical protein
MSTKFGSCFCLSFTFCWPSITLAHIYYCQYLGMKLTISADVSINDLSNHHIFLGKVIVVDWSNWNWLEAKPTKTSSCRRRASSNVACACKYSS